MRDEIVDYYDHICKEWNFIPTELSSTGYESVEKDLRLLSKERWEKENDSGKAAIEQEVFNIYRSVNVLPIVYYSLEGCIQELKQIASKNSLVENGQIGTGRTAGQSFCRFWFPNMQEARTHKDKEVSLKDRFYNDTKLKRAINLCYKHRNEGELSVLPLNLKRALDLVNGSSIQNFKPMNARAIYEEICPHMFGRVLDFSSGYGGRMVGALTSSMRYHYTGIEPNTKTYTGLYALGHLFTELQLGNGFEMNHTVSEEFDANPNSFDAAFSSPPYFNLEIYSNEPTQCMNRYKNIDSWFESYVEPTLKMLYKVLNKDAIYAVNISDYTSNKVLYKIEERWVDLSKKLGFNYERDIKMLLNARPGTGNNKANNQHKFEKIYVFRKTQT